MTISNFKDKELTTLTNQSLKSLGKLDVSSNLLQDFNGIGSCSGSLKWFNASHNQITNIEHLKECKALNVLNLSNNKISSLKSLAELKHLNALILNNNCLSNLDGIQGLEALNTLVVSGNAIEVLDVSSLIKLQKLSASNNKLKAFPDLRGLKSIADLKLNKNQIDSLPVWLPKCTRLKVLDLGNNNLADLVSIELLGKLPSLENLNLRGNPVCSDPEYVIMIKELLPNLKILDYKKLSDLYYKAIEEKSKNKKIDKEDQGNIKGEVVEEKSNNLNRGFKKSTRFNVVNPITPSDNKNDTETVIDSVQTDGNKENSKKKKKKRTKNERRDENTSTTAATDSNAGTMKVSQSCLEDPNIEGDKKSANRSKTTNSEEEIAAKKSETIENNLTTASPNKKRKRVKEQSSKKSKKSKKDEKSDKKKKKKDTGVVSITRIKKVSGKKDPKEILIPSTFEVGTENAW